MNIQQGKRRVLPPQRKGFTQKVTIGGNEIHLRTGEYEDGSLGEICLDAPNEGGAFRTMLYNFSAAVSVGLQCGVPLGTFVEEFTSTRFEPSGVVVGSKRVKSATSIFDYVFRELGIYYLERDDLSRVQQSVGKPESLTHLRVVRVEQPGE